MDLVYYESPPGLQLLHCLKYGVCECAHILLYSFNPSCYRNDDMVVGGESLLLDAYPVLEEMRTQYPKEFDILTKIPATFQKVHHKR